MLIAFSDKKRTRIQYIHPKFEEECNFSTITEAVRLFQPCKNTRDSLRVRKKGMGVCCITYFLLSNESSKLVRRTDEIASPKNHYSLPLMGPSKFKQQPSTLIFIILFIFIFSTHPLPDPHFTPVINLSHLTHRHYIWIKL